MNLTQSIAIYLIHPNKHDADFLPSKNYLKELPEIKLFECINECDKKTFKSAVSNISPLEYDKIILAGENPGFYKDLFLSQIALAGKNPEILLLNFCDYGLNHFIDNKRLIAAFLGLVYNIPFKKLLSNGNLPVNDQTLIIGAGIAGIQAALEIANANKKVFLLEKNATIGGHMAMFDKTFPTLDCAACILTPKMVEVGQHPNIDLLTYSELLEVKGNSGNYQVKIKKKARKVDLKKCIGCGSCSARCPSHAPSEFDSGISLRNAIYIPFPQAVPNKYVVDSAICRYVESPYEINAQTIKELNKTAGFPKEITEKLVVLKNKEIKSAAEFNSVLIENIGEQDTEKYGELIFEHTGACKNCVRFCPVNDCIDLDEQDEEVEINVGNIILATGFKAFDAKKAIQYGYGVYPNVLTSLELERLINASGPTSGKIVLAGLDKKGNRIFDKEGEKPKSVAIVHCVGSRDVNHNKYCSKVCCMYSLKLAHLVKEKLPETTVYEYFIDMRAYGKGYEEFYNRIRNEGINIIRGKTAKVELKDDHLWIRGEDILKKKLIEEKIEMVVLAIGLEPASDNKALADILGIQLSAEGWFKENLSDTETTLTNNQGIKIAGVCQGPKDIPDSVAQASAAAADVLKSILKGEIKGETKEINLQHIEKIVKEQVQ